MRRTMRLLGLFGVGLGTVGAAATTTPLPAQSRAGANTPVPARAPVPPALATSDAPLVLRGVTVIDVRRGRRLPNRTVVLAERRIQALGRAGAVRVPRGARVIDARGKYLMPGLWEMHAHTKEFADVAYPLFIANGVTGVRDAGSNVPLATLGQWKREIAEGQRVGPRLIVSGPIIEERIPDNPGDTVNVIQGKDNAAHRIYVPLAAARRVVDSLKAAGADMLKIYWPPRDIRLALMAEAKRVGIRFGGHAGGGMSGQEFSDSGATIVDHDAFTWEDTSFNVCGEEGSEDAPLAHFNGPRCAAAVRRLWQNHTWITTGAFFQLPERVAAQGRRYLVDSLAYAGLLQDIRQHPVVQGDTAQLDALVAAQEQTSTAAWDRVITAYATRYQMWLASDQGRPLADSLRRYQIQLPIVIGTDANVQSRMPPALPGFAVHESLLLLARHRFPAAIVTHMPPTLLATLQTATLNPARALQATDSLGTVEAGKLADLVLLDGDPLQDIWNITKIRAVVANGRYYDRAALDELLQSAQRAAAVYRASSRRP